MFLGGASLAGASPHLARTPIRSDFKKGFAQLGEAFLLAAVMLDNTHEAFSPPVANCTLWRYTDLTKFLSLLESQKLFFPRVDQFEDPFEGSLSSKTIAILRDPKLNDGLPKEVVESLITQTQNMRKQMFVSCWFASEHESAAMWKLYLQSPEGVAIKSDHLALTAALRASPYMARTSVVKYIDYENDEIPTRNLFFAFLHKRLSFAHENELRALIWSFENVNQPHVAKDETALTVEIVPEELIKAIHVSPTAPSWFGTLVEQLTRRYSLNIPVIHSSLYDRPTY